MAHWKYVEAGAEVQHDGDVSVPCCFFLGKLDRRNGMPELGGTMSVFDDDMSLFNIIILAMSFTRFLPGGEEFLVVEVYVAKRGRGP